jgi:hypothetical protein
MRKLEGHIAQARRGITSGDWAYYAICVEALRDEANRILAGGVDDGRVPLESTCFRCGKPASAFPEYGPAMTGSSLTAAEYVRAEEGTYNPDTNHFACDECYIAIGMPSSRRGWKAP